MSKIVLAHGATRYLLGLIPLLTSKTVSTTPATEGIKTLDIPEQWDIILSNSAILHKQAGIQSQSDTVVVENRIQQKG